MCSAEVRWCFLRILSRMRRRRQRAICDGKKNPCPFLNSGFPLEARVMNFLWSCTFFCHICVSKRGWTNSFSLGLSLYSSICSGALAENLNYTDKENLRKRNLLPRFHKLFSVGFTKTLRLTLFRIFNDIFVFQLEDESVWTNLLAKKTSEFLRRLRRTCRTHIYRIEPLSLVYTYDASISINTSISTKNLRVNGCDANISALFFSYLSLRLCLCLRRPDLHVRRNDASISTSRREWNDFHSLVFVLVLLLASLRRTCKPGRRKQKHKRKER